MKIALLAVVLVVPTVPMAAHAANNGKPDKANLICRDIDETGSRLRSNRVCMTKDQWDEARRTAQESVDQGQRRLITACPPRTIC